MSEYEIIDIMANLHSNFLEGQLAFFSIITAYVVVAYTVGQKLTMFQSAFSSLFMVAFVIMVLGGQYHDITEIYYYQEKLLEFRQKPIATGELAKWGFLLRPLLVVGALIFMWQVRHPKIE